MGVVPIKVGELPYETAENKWFKLIGTTKKTTTVGEINLSTLWVW